MAYKIFCDGATSNNGQNGAKGGWAFSIYDDDGNWLVNGSGYHYIQLITVWK